MIRNLLRAALLAPIGAVLLMASPAAAHDPGDWRYWNGRHSDSWRDRRDDRFDWHEERRERFRDRREARREWFEDRWDDKRDRFDRRHRLWVERHHHRNRGLPHALHQGWRGPFWVPPHLQRERLLRRQHRRHDDWRWRDWRD